MKIKSIQQLRRAIITKKKLIENLASSNYEPDFMGYISQDRKKFGFFEAYHGDKKNVRAFLSTLLRIAEDGQAIYEFIQNAADCGSNMFSIFYDENFFLALNNGKPFSNEDIDSLLNVSQSSKSSCDKIGRFGIGFKLVHRLVGKNEGLKELTEEYKGPILFTWSKPEHLTALISTENAEGIEYDSDMTSDTPTLFKIIITNFPVQPNEEVKTLEHENRVLFSSQEFLELVHFLKKNEKYIDFSRLEQGSIFFLKLGEAKSEALHKHYQENLRKGVQCSLNMLKSLETVIVNNERIERLPLKTIDFTIPQTSETFKRIEPEYQKCDIKITFGYLPYLKNESLKEYSNFYKYFPMGDEDHSLKFIIHCDAFNINASRRELQESTTNIEIFKWFITQLREQLDSYKISRPEDFLEIYANLLLSERPKQSKQWLTQSLYEPLIRYIKSNIPVQTGDFLTQDQVRIKGTLLSITPQDFGININWFYWEGKGNEILKAARDKQKLSLYTWKIEDLLNHGAVENINYWIAQIDDKAYVNFLDELNQIDFEKMKFANKFYLLKIFKFNDKYYSINELNDNENLILIFDKVQVIKSDLWEKLDFNYSSLNISKYKNLASQIKTVLKHFEVKVYERITSKAQKVRLTPQEKSSLFSVLVILDGIGDVTLSQLTLFKNRCQILTPLGQLIGNIKNLPFWLAIYQIDEEEYVQCPQVNKYLLKEDNIYDTIIQPKWEKIIEQVAIGDNIAFFYEDVKRYFELSSNKGSLTNNAYIFTTQGFKTINKVFYSSKLSQCQSYQNLKIAIETLTNLCVPNKIVIKYLSEPPFQTNQDSLYDCMEKVGNDSAELEQKSVENLIQFTNKIGEAFFTFFYVTRTTQSDIYLVYYKTNNPILQYFSEQPKLIKYIQQKLSDNFKALPAELYDKKINNTGLLVNDELYQELLTKHFSEDLIESVRESGFKSVELMFLQRIPSLTLVQGEKYQKTSYTYQVLDLACQCLTEQNELREGFTKRIRIYTLDGESQEIRNISINNNVTFDLDDKTYELKLSDILPQYEGSSGLLAEIMQQLKGLSLRLVKLFDIGRKKDLDEVYFEVQQNGQLLQNASQLAFVILYAKYKNDINLLKGFMVKNNAE